MACSPWSRSPRPSSGGLIATDRLVLSPRARLLAQGVHRATAVCALGFLLAHIGVKVAEAHTTTTAALLPFASGITGRDGLVGLGTVAAYLLVLAAATGALRSAFAARGRARRWRFLHGCAYAAWCAAILHGLNAGRAPAGWVTASYALCLTAVAGALVLRVARARRRPPHGRARPPRRRPDRPRPRGPPRRPCRPAPARRPRRPPLRPRRSGPHPMSGPPCPSRTRPPPHRSQPRAASCPNCPPSASSDCPASPQASMRPNGWTAGRTWPCTARRPHSPRRS
ncbi:hypothetical protein GCM10020000_55030 [Streptomyces olivoverticillatus]